MLKLELTSFDPGGVVLLCDFHAGMAEQDRNLIDRCGTIRLALAASARRRLELAAIHLGLFPTPRLRALASELALMDARNPFGATAAPPVFIFGLDTTRSMAGVDTEHRPLQRIQRGSTEPVSSYKHRTNLES